MRIDDNHFYQFECFQSKLVPNWLPHVNIIVTVKALAGTIWIGLVTVRKSLIVSLSISSTSICGSSICIRGVCLYNHSISVIESVPSPNNAAPQHRKKDEYEKEYSPAN
jgi:hypothetical protein